MVVIRWVILVFVLVFLLPVTSGCSRKKRPRDTTPPSLTCPSDIHQIADPIQNNAKVTWTEPRAYDNGAEVSVRRVGLGPGKLFQEGTHTIEYSARDRSGNTASCSFMIFIRVVRCSWFLTPSDGYRICHLSTDMRYGSTCRFGCYPGHELLGPSRTKCQNDGRWSIPTQPTCKKLTCREEELQPTADQIGITTVTCTDSNNYRSKCTYSCKEGYSVRQGYSKVRVCGAHGSWVGATPICVDTKAPEFTNCPKVMTRYAERSRTTGRAIWDDPIVTDNSGKVTLSQIDGPESGTELEVGEYYIQYRAIDEAENRANCQFNLVVKLITCPAIYPLPRTSVTCPTGRLWGSTCQFACDNNTANSLPLETVCDRHGSKYYYGAWDFGNQQPYCEQENECPDLRAPDNGALACDRWLGGRYCQMLCQNGYTVYESPGDKVHQGLLVCGNSGVWRISDDIPNCVEEDPRVPVTITAHLEYGFYDGPCEKAIDEIRADFLTSFNTSLPGTCSPPQCTVANVQVICGTTTKRDTSSHVSASITLKLSDILSYAEIIAFREILKKDITEARNRNEIDLTVGNQLLSAGNIEIEHPEANCPSGLVPDSVLKCVKCGIGSYANDTMKPPVCTKCDIGYYQDETGQASCKKCPDGMTTETTGARECKEACPAGYFSAKGTTPCSPCDIGTYTVLQGTRECSLCPGSMTTNKTGSTAADRCFEFDIEFTIPDNEDFVAPSVVMDTSSLHQFGVSMWLKCTSCDDLMSITDLEGDNFLKIQDDAEKHIKVGSVLLPETLTFTTNQWQYLYIDVSPSSLRVFIDGEIMQIATMAMESFPYSLNVSIGGPGYIGRISQVNVHSTLSTQRRRRSTQVPGDTCFSGSHGDVLPWREFALLDGSFVQTRSKCDAFDNCLSSPCHNNGICTDAIDNFICECTKGFTGRDCSENIDDCEHSVCDNNGTCVDGVDGYTCNCPTGFSGELCEIKVVDGAWGSYCNWSLCSVTCGTGEQSRQRTCDNPEPSNGGEDCVGSELDTRSCVLEDCVNKCLQDPVSIKHGSLNCFTDMDAVTRRCDPKCDEGYEFDSEDFVYPSIIVCGPVTGYEWNFVSDINPYGFLPNCQAKKKGDKNTALVDLDYNGLNTNDEQVFIDIKNIATNFVLETACVSNKTCTFEKAYVGLSGGTTSRRRRSTNYVTVTIEISCIIHSSIDECYNLLASVVYELNDLIGVHAFTVTYDGSGYDVTLLNTSSVDGTTLCEKGHVPVFHYCVACGPGMYQNGDFCDRCSVGYYQDETGQTQCKQCPDGWTTLGEQSRSSSHCNVEVVVGESVSKSSLLVVIIVTATWGTLLSAVGFGILVCKHIQTKKNKIGADVLDMIDRGDYNSKKIFPGPPLYNAMYSDSPPPTYTEKQGLGQIDEDFWLPDVCAEENSPTKP